MRRSAMTRSIASALTTALVVAACGGAGPATPAATATATLDVPSAAPNLMSPTAAAVVRDAGMQRTDSHGVAQVWVPGGTFTMGQDNTASKPPTWARNEALTEQPAHAVTLSRGYWIDTTEVTVASFDAFKAAGGYDDQALWSADGWRWRQRQGTKPLPDACQEQSPDEPQVCVTWYEAEAYAHWRGGRLPTEAEWEFAARGPQSLVYPWGNDYDATRATLDGGTGPMPVGSFPKGASWVGALDMAGNAMEWVADWWSASYYAGSPDSDPPGPATGSIKVEKGGWWGPADNSGAYVGRAAYRHFEDPPLYDDHHIGFRIVSAD